MIVDSSAIVAIFFQEPGYRELAQKIVDTQNVGIGAPTLVECAIVLTARLGTDARAMLARFMEEANITVVPFTERHFGEAVRAWIRYGMARHPAGLNFGDCLAYAVAVLAGMPFLCIGDDFSLTDLALA